MSPLVNLLAQYQFLFSIVGKTAFFMGEWIRADDAINDFHPTTTHLCFNVCTHARSVFRQQHVRLPGVQGGGVQRVDHAVHGQREERAGGDGRDDPQPRAPTHARATLPADSAQPTETPRGSLYWHQGTPWRLPFVILHPQAKLFTYQFSRIGLRKISHSSNSTRSLRGRPRRSWVDPRYPHRTHRTGVYINPPAISKFPTSIKSIFFTESYWFNLHVIPFDLHFHYIDNAFMCTA